MIAYLQGTITSYTKDGAIILVNGVGYECIGLWLKQKPLLENISLYTYHYLENQSIPRLIACQSQSGKELLLQLLSVSGVGPKMASRILDVLSPDQLIKAISSSDLATLSQVKGLGKKTAQKIILELGKTLVLTSSTSSPYLDALISLGFSNLEINQAIEKLDLSKMNENQAIAAILRTLGRTQ